jgi:type IX secretion system PorP/SprF family membrane protein
MKMLIFAEMKIRRTTNNRAALKKAFAKGKALACIIALCAWISGTEQSADAQQMPILTQNMFNPFIINPAIAGSNNYYKVNINSRLQWAGFKDGPVTNCITGYGPHPNKKLNMGFGATVISDITSPSSRNELMGSYAYNIAINREIRISFGASLGLMQYKVDPSALVVYNTDGSATNDPTLLSMSGSKVAPDANIGVYLWSTDFNVGLSAVQLFNNRLKDSDNGMVFARLRTHFYLTGGYSYFINREFKLEPSIILKGVYPNMPQLDLNCKVEYNKLVWGALSFRTNDAISILLGYNYEKKIYLGYSCDFAINGIRKYGLTSHELMFGYRFNDLR